jgi:DNA-binding NtrC family response regulator
MIKILYVDDEADTEKMASKFEIMSSMGVEAIPVTHVDAVLPKLKELGDEIKLLVLDIIMPPEDVYSLEETSGGTSTGLRLLKDIRGSYKTLPILIVSVRGQGDIEKQYDVKDYLEKPVSAYKVAHTVKRIIRETATSNQK